MESLGKYLNRRISCIANNSERYISFSLGSLRFIDSFQFLGTSLEKLVNSLAAEGKDKFKLLTRYVADPAKQDLLLRKGVYPYDYVDSPERLKETSYHRRRISTAFSTRKLSVRKIMHTPKKYGECSNAERSGTTTTCILEVT